LLRPPSSLPSVQLLGKQLKVKKIDPFHFMSIFQSSEKDSRKGGTPEILWDE